MGKPCHATLGENPISFQDCQQDPPPSRSFKISLLLIPCNMLLGQQPERYGQILSTAGLQLLQKCLDGAALPAVSS